MGGDVNKDAEYYENTLRLDYQWLDDMAIIEAQSVDHFTERRWMPRRLKDYYSTEVVDQNTV
jgi:hypothetical protein